MTQHKVLFPEHREAHRLLDGMQGVEIGPAAHNPFNIPGCWFVELTGGEGEVDKALHDTYVAAQQANTGFVSRVDIYSEADLLPFADASLDYVLSSHMVEHLPNPIGAFREWQRVIRPGGIVFMILPKRDALPADVGRSATELAEHIHAFKSNWTAKTRPYLSTQGPRGHYSVFTVRAMLELVTRCNDLGLLNWKSVLIEPTDSKVGNGHTFAYEVGSLEQIEIQKAGENSGICGVPA